MKKLFVFVLIGVLLATGGFLIWRASNVDTGDDAIVENESLPELDASMAGVPKLIIGDESAPITIVEYGDFQCPICKRFFEQTEPELISEYIDTKKAKIEFRIETHIGPDSARAGEAAYCAADQNQFRAKVS